MTRRATKPIQMSRGSDSKSHAENFQGLPAKKKLRFLESLSTDELMDLRSNWDFWARPNQREPITPYLTWIILAGRGFGKTRTAAEWVISKAEKNPGCRIGLIGATTADTRDIMIKGESGLIECQTASNPLKYVPSLRTIKWANGSIGITYSAEEPERLRGPQHHYIWGDEYCSWKRKDTLDMADFGLRLGLMPHKIITTTPKPSKEFKKVLAGSRTIITKGSTFDNESNLPPSFLDHMEDKYGGTTLGRQELYAEVMDQAEGALFTRINIDKNRVDRHPKLSSLIVAVDPAVTNNETSDETGIVVAGAVERDFYVLEDSSLKASPDQWARKVVDLYHRYNVDYVVVEKNNGGDLLALVMKTVDPSIRIKEVHASKGKYARAEPIAALYEQNRVHHVGVFEELEEQMCTWTIENKKESPDRMDALVWAIAFLNKRGSSNFDDFHFYKKEQKIDELF